MSAHKTGKTFTLWVYFSQFMMVYMMYCWHDMCYDMFSFMFLAVQNRSIGDLVTNSLTHSMTKGTFSFDIQKATLETCEF